MQTNFLLFKTLISICLQFKWKTINNRYHKTKKTTNINNYQTTIYADKTG